MAGLTGVRADELTALEVFGGYPAEALIPLAAQLSPLSAASGQVLMQQGELALSFLLIRSGEAEVAHAGTDGHDTVAKLTSRFSPTTDFAAAIGGVADARYPRLFDLDTFQTGRAGAGRRDQAVGRSIRCPRPAHRVWWRSPCRADSCR